MDFYTTTPICFSVVLSSVIPAWICKISRTPFLPHRHTQDSFSLSVLYTPNNMNFKCFCSEFFKIWFFVFYVDVPSLQHIMYFFSKIQLVYFCVTHTEFTFFVNTSVLLLIIHLRDPPPDVALRCFLALVPEIPKYFIVFFNDSVLQYIVPDTSTPYIYVIFH